MTLRIQRLSTLTEEDLAEIVSPITAVLGTFPEDRFSPIAIAQRPDYSQLIVEGYRSSGGASLYFLRDTRRASSPESTSETATPFEASGRLYLDLGGASITQLYYGDYDGDLSNDIILRLSDGSLRALGTGDGSLSEPISPEELAAESAPYDPEPAAPTGPRQNRRPFPQEEEEPPPARSGSGTGTATAAQSLNPTIRMGI